MHPEELYAMRAIRAGASGYLTKSAAAGDLIHAIKTVHAGRKFLSANLAEMIFDKFNDPAPAEPHTLLSDREFQILCLVGAGSHVTDIARRLCLSAATVNTYRRRILLKLDMRTHVELTKYVVEKRLIV